jgi:hypothetical protein
MANSIFTHLSPDVVFWIQISQYIVAFGVGDAAVKAIYDLTPGETGVKSIFIA